MENNSVKVDDIKYRCVSNCCIRRTKSVDENDNNTKSISKVEVIVPEFNENTVLTEATNSNTNIYSNIDFDSAILLCRKWTTINQHDTKLTRAIIENKLETHPDTNDNYMVKKLVMNIFDNVIKNKDLFNI